jgi:hypothetical protein
VLASRQLLKLGGSGRRRCPDPKREIAAVINFLDSPGGAACFTGALIAADGGRTAV